MKSFFVNLMFNFFFCLLSFQVSATSSALNLFNKAEDTEMCLMCDPVSDSLALVALYNATEGTNWKNKWDLKQSMSNWYGVSLNQERCVTSLMLYSNDLKGSIPPEIGQLSNLGWLNLYDNQLRGSIPPEIGQLFNLRVLQLFANQLSGSIPPEIGQLSQLTNLRLDFNYFRGSIPSEIGQLSNLGRLQLSSNQLDGNIPPEIGRLSKLTSLRLASNQLSGSIPSEIGQLSQLRSLQLSFNQLNGNIPPELGKLTHLKTFLLNNNELEGCFPLEFNIFCKLRFYNKIHQKSTSRSRASHGYNFTKNPKLPGGGDFEDFCKNQSGACPPPCPSAGISSSIQFCENSNLNLFKSLGGAPSKEGMWTVNPTTGVDLTNPNAVTFSLDTGLYVFTYRIDSKNCVAKESTVTVRLMNCDTKFDSEGGEYFERQMIVKLGDISRKERDELRAEFHATVLDSCLCGYLETWEVPEQLDVSVDGQSVVLTDIDHKIKHAKKKNTKIEDCDRNYKIKLRPLNKQKKKELNIEEILNQTIQKNEEFSEQILSKVIVALIDTGTDAERFYKYLKKKDNELDYNNEDGNCIIDSIGYNFVQNNGDINDYLSHGKLVTKKIINGFLETSLIENTNLSDSISILPIKVQTGRTGNLFDLLCGMGYAASEGADIINCSIGYYGEESSILDTLIKELQDSSILLIASAGNGSLNTDDFRHHPSGAWLYGGYDNVMSVAASEGTAKGFSSDSNSGFFSTQIAYRGNFGNSKFKGTSYAAPGITSIAAVLKSLYPKASYRNIKNAILRSANSNLKFPILTGGIANFDRANKHLENILNNPHLETNTCAGCEAYLELKGDLYSGVYQSVDSIYATSKIVDTNPTFVTKFTTGQSITLAPGFEVISGATFVAEIKTQNNKSKSYKHGTISIENGMAKRAHYKELKTNEVYSKKQ